MQLLFMLEIHTGCVYLKLVNLRAVISYSAWPRGNRRSLIVKVIV